jgi:hypothetical protein
VVAETIIKQLNALRDAAAPLTLVTIRGIFVMTILDMASKIFEQKAHNGTTFRCLDSFLWKWLHETMNWSEWKATRAAVVGSEALETCRGCLVMFEDIVVAQPPVGLI